MSVRPTDVPTLVPLTAANRPANRDGDAAPDSALLTHVVRSDAVDLRMVTQELRERVSSRLTSSDESWHSSLDGEASRVRMRGLVLEELESWVLHRHSLGQPTPSLADEDRVIDDVLAALSGLGRLEPLLARSDVEDIYFNGTAETRLRLGDGTIVAGPPIASTDGELLDLIQRLGTTVGDGSTREFATSRPLLSLRLKAVGDLGARLSAAMDVTPHPAGTIRVHRHVEADLDELYRLGMIDAPLVAFLRAAVLAGLKICVVGAMSAGKTFLLRALCAEIPVDKMIVTVEDERELGLHVLPKRNVRGEVVRGPGGTVELQRPAALVRAYESRPANSEGAGRVDLADLMYHALRDSADVLVLGETRGGDIVHLLDAATNGTSGVMCTMHANSAEEVFDRIVQLVLKARPPLPVEWALRAATALDLIVHVRRTAHHERFVSEIVEVRSGQLGERGAPVVTHLFAPRADGRAVPTGHRPAPELQERLAAVGFSADWFQPALSDWDTNMNTSRASSGWTT